MRAQFVIPVLASILILGSFGLTQQASAVHFVDNFVEAHWDFGFAIALDEPHSPTEPPIIFSSTYPVGTSPFVLFCDSGTGTCSIDLPNIIDDLDAKFIEIDIMFMGPAISPIGPATGFGIDLEEGPASCFEVFSFLEGPSTWSIGLSCSPNPDFETILIPFSPADLAAITAIWVETESFSSSPVGGTSLPIDTTSLLLAGASVNAWMIPVVLSAAGFGILIARKI